MKSWEDYKGLRWYLVVVFMFLSFYVYSQNIGWLWWGSTSTSVPKEGQGHAGRTGTGYRYFYHK